MNFLRASPRGYKETISVPNSYYLSYFYYNSVEEPEPHQDTDPDPNWMLKV
jgi:hypothetical protein